MPDSLIDRAKGLAKVSPAAAREYRLKAPRLLKFVNDTLGSLPLISSIIGHNSLQTMFDNHANHARLMTNVLDMNRFDLLARLLPWAYHSYHSRGFNYEYFPLELRTWIDAIAALLTPQAGREVRPIYEWMIACHGEVVRLADDESYAALPADGAWNAQAEPFLAALLKGQHLQCLQIAAGAMAAGMSLAGLYLDILQPTMYRVGDMWERGKVSVAQEHLATSIVARVMAAAYQRLPLSVQTKGRAVITAASNERHELGPRMVADLLEQDGWQIIYLGADAPTGDVLSLLASEHPQLLAISATMPFNLDHVSATVAAIRGDARLSHMRIVVGGQAFLLLPDLWQMVGADGFAPDGRTAVELAARWWGEMAR